MSKARAGSWRGRPPTGQSLAEHIRHLGGEDGHVYVGQPHRLATTPHQDTRSRLTAIGLLLDRGYGKAPQAIEHSGSLETSSPLFAQEQLRHLSDDELAPAPRARVRHSWRTLLAVPAEVWIMYQSNLRP